MRHAASSSPSTTSLLMPTWAYMPVGSIPRNADCRGAVHWQEEGDVGSKPLCRAFLPLRTLEDHKPHREDYEDDADELVPHKLFVEDQ